MHETYAASVHFQGESCRFQDDYVLGPPAHLTNTWEPGEVIKQVREVAVPAEDEHRRCSLVLGVWDPQQSATFRSAAVGSDRSGVPC
jgi:hypothetical protein